VPAVEVTWAELLAHPDVTTTVTLASDVGLLAYHGGVETATFEVASAAARRSGASLYALHQPETLRWHVPSALVDPGEDPGLASVLDHVRVALSIHGYGRRGRPWDILLGGTNRALAAVLAATLRARLPDIPVVDDLATIPPALRGLHPANPVNRPADGGVQVELPLRLRLSSDHLAPVTEALAVVATTWSEAH
jgi:phage replication-related protein YjqB (UPF0714/DUF867 family)